MNCVLGCFGNCRNMIIPEEESENAPSSKTIISHVFEYIPKCANNGIHPLKYGKTCIPIPHQPEYYDHIIWYLQKGAQII